MKKYPTGSWQEALLSFNDQERLLAAKEKVGELAKSFAQSLTNCSILSEPQRRFAFVTVAHVIAGYMAQGNSELQKLVTLEKQASSAEEKKGWTAAYEFWSDLLAMSQAGLQRANEMCPGLGLKDLASANAEAMEAMIRLDRQQPHPPNN